MSRAYCLTCNEQVTMTASGTCPDGHAVSADDGAGPEPWVGSAADETVEATSAMQEIDIADLQELQAVGASSANGNGHASANGNGTTNGHLAGHGHAPTPDTRDPEDDPAPRPVDRQRANSQASDDLAAMLADALQAPGADDAPTSAGPEVDPPPTTDSVTDTPSTSGPGSQPTAEDEEDWSDLATLAAELQLDTGLPQGAQDDEPEAPTGAQVDDEPADVATAPDEDLPSPAPVEDPVDEVPPPAPEDEDDSTTSSVDLTNFTARGARVGGSGKSPRRLFGRKR